MHFQKCKEGPYDIKVVICASDATQYHLVNTPRPRAALLMCLKKYSAIGNSAIGNYVVLCSKLILKTVLLEVSYGKND